MAEIKKKGWKDLAHGDVLEAGTAAEFETGNWRSEVPERDTEKCNNCLICWINCPDSSIILKDGKITGIDLKYCKGCGICAKVCPPKIQAITMVPEKKSGK